MPTNQAPPPIYSLRGHEEQGDQRKREIRKAHATSTVHNSRALWEEWPQGRLKANWSKGRSCQFSSAPYRRRWPKGLRVQVFKYVTRTGCDKAFLRQGQDAC